jgi:hypothetical protein
MEKKNFNLSIATVTFVVGAFFVLANTKDITGGVIGATGPGGTVTAITGLILIIASAGFFVVTINHGEKSENIELESLIRKTKNHEDISIAQEIRKRDTKDKYDQGQGKEEYEK